MHVKVYITEKGIHTHIMSDMPLDSSNFLSKFSDVKNDLTKRNRKLFIWSDVFDSSLCKDKNYFVEKILKWHLFSQFFCRSVYIHLADKVPVVVSTFSPYKITFTTHVDNKKI